MRRRSKLNVGDEEMAPPPDPRPSGLARALAIEGIRFLPGWECEWCKRPTETLDEHGRCGACRRREYAAEIDEAAREERDQDLRWRDADAYI